jgi:hypothetical protein
MKATDHELQKYDIFTRYEQLEVGGSSLIYAAAVEAPVPRMLPRIGIAFRQRND